MGGQGLGKSELDRDLTHGWKKAEYDKTKRTETPPAIPIGDPTTGKRNQNLGPRAFFASVGILRWMVSRLSFRRCDGRGTEGRLVFAGVQQPVACYGKTEKQAHPGLASQLTSSWMDWCYSGYAFDTP